MPELQEFLQTRNADTLKESLRALDVNPGTLRKAEVVDLLKKILLGKQLFEIWKNLSELEQSALAETCHAPDLSFHESRFRAKYGELPKSLDRDDSWRYPRSSEEEREKKARVSLFLYFSRDSSGLAMPDDLAAALREFVTPPEVLKVKTMSEPISSESLFVRQTEPEALAEVLTLMHAAEKGELRMTEKTGMPTAAGRGKILPYLTNGDYFPPEIASPPNKEKWRQEIGLIKPIGWLRLLHAGGYLVPGGTRSKLTRQGIKSLSQSPHEIIRHLWKKWVGNSLYDEFNRIDDIKGQRSKGHMTAKPARRKVIVEALQECPVGEWVDFRKFSSFMQSEGYDFEVSITPWKLYFCDQEYGNFGYAGYGEWSVVQGRYLMALLFEYAAPLGLIDIAYEHPKDSLPDYRDQWGADDFEWLSRYDGLRSFRITPLGAYCLGLSSDYQPTARQSSLELEVTAGRVLILKSEKLPEVDRLLIETWATPLKDLSAQSWKLSADRIRDAIERKLSLDDFISFLERASGGELPRKLRFYFDHCLEKSQSLKLVGDAQIFQCRDLATISLILEDASLKKLCSRCGEIELVVREGNVSKFQKRVRALGLGFL